jgi:hypothetical protein
MPNAQSAPGWLVPQQRINLSPVPQQTGLCVLGLGVRPVVSMGLRPFFAISAESLPHLPR